MSGGWIKLHRRLRDHPVWSDAQPLCRRAAWIDLLLRAAWADGDRVKRGQILTSQVRLAADWRWPRKGVKRFIDWLIEEQMIDHERRSSFSVITVLNYERFQDLDDDEWPRNGHERDTKRDMKRPRNGRRMAKKGTHYKNKEEEQEEEGRNPIGEGEQPQVSFPASLDRPDVRTALTEWTAYRDSIGRPFPPASLAQNLRLFADRPDELITAIHRSIALGYVGLLPAAATAAAAPVEEEEPEWIKFVEAEKAKQQKAKLQ